MTYFLIVDPVACISATICKDEFAFSMDTIIGELSFVRVTIGPSKGTMTCDTIIDPVTTIIATIGIVVYTESMFTVI